MGRCKRGEVQKELFGGKKASVRRRKISKKKKKFRNGTIKNRKRGLERRENSKTGFARGVARESKEYHRDREMGKGGRTQESDLKRNWCHGKKETFGRGLKDLVGLRR